MSDLYYISIRDNYDNTLYVVVRPHGYGKYKFVYATRSKPDYRLIERVSGWNLLSIMLQAEDYMHNKKWSTEVVADGN